MDVAYLVELGLPVSHSLSVWCRCCASRVRFGSPWLEAELCTGSESSQRARGVKLLNLKTCARALGFRGLGV